MNLIEKVWFKCPNCGMHQMTIYNDAIVRCNKHKCQYALNANIVLSHISNCDIGLVNSFYAEHMFERNMAIKFINHQLLFKSSFVSIIRDIYFVKTLVDSSDNKLKEHANENGVKYGITTDMVKSVFEMNFDSISGKDWHRITALADNMTKDWEYTGFKKWMKNLVN